jgi:hypothetical protein
MIMSTIRNWQSTPAERIEPFPCDDLGPGEPLFRAIDIAAPPAIVFRWLCQLRVAPYSYDWLDNRGHQSPRELTPGLEKLEVGQRVMKIFKLVEFEQDRSITLVLDRMTNWFGDLALTYRVTPTATGSRLVVKMLLTKPPGIAGLFAKLLPAGDLVMMRKQLRTIRALATA